jgi:hypothetical protein
LVVLIVVVVVLIVALIGGSYTNRWLVMLKVGRGHKLVENSNASTIVALVANVGLQNALLQPAD